jgi:molecular chaperone HscC
MLPQSAVIAAGSCPWTGASPLLFSLKVRAGRLRSRKWLGGNMRVCGIDLGTTNSLIAVFDDVAPRLIPNALGDLLTPSAVGIDDSGDVLVGKAARERLLSHPGRTVASFKRLMGTEQQTQLGKLLFRPEELSALVLRSLKADAEQHLGAPIDEVVISVPAYFNDHQRKATLDAGRLAGLKVERLVNEPTAAALAYGLSEAAEGKFLVFDLGGGTFDVSILDKYEGVMEVRATAGDTRLGGEDFSAVIEQTIAHQSGISIKDLTATDRARLRRAAEGLKFELTKNEAASYHLTFVGREISGTITRGGFEVDAAPLLRRLRTPVERTIRDARLAPEDLTSIVLVGGATRMPMVRSMVARLFGRLPLVHVDPDQTVALGAAVQAGLKARARALDDIVMTDVCPFTLGIATVDDLGSSEIKSVTPIIERNAMVPISRSRSFFTVGKNQRALEVEVYQGENLRPEHNVKLGSFKVRVPPNEPGAEKVDVRFTYDINGAVEVEATVVSTGLIEKRIFRNLSGLSEADLQARFAALEKIKLHPREQAENQLLIARAERIYAEQRGEMRDALRAALAQFEIMIVDQQRRDLAEIRSQFAAVLDGFEP